MLIGWIGIDKIRPVFHPAGACGDNTGNSWFIKLFWESEYLDRD